MSQVKTYHKKGKLPKRGAERRQKSTEFQMAERRIAVTRLSGMGHTRAEIRLVMMREFDYSEAQIQNSLKQLDEDLAAETGLVREEARRAQVHRLRTIMRLAVEDKKYGPAVNAEIAIARIEGNFAPERVMLSADEELRSAFASYAAGLTQEEIDRLAEEGAALSAPSSPALPEGKAPAMNGKALTNGKTNGHSA